MTTLINDAFELLTEEFMSLSEQTKIHVLVALASELTLVARGAYGTEDAVEKLWASNEMIHRVLGVVLPMMQGGAGLEWQRSVLEILLYRSAEEGSGEEILLSVRRVLGRWRS